MNTSSRIAKWVAVASLLGMAKATAQSFVFASGLAQGGIVPDGNLAGWADTRTVSGLPYTSIGTIKVSLALNGGTSGDLYAFLSNGTGMSVLLNRPGVTGSDAFGYADGDLSIVFSDAATNGDIHLYQNSTGDYYSGGEFEPDGRAVSPLVVTDASPRTAGLGAAFAGSNPNAVWTLFVADVVSGGAPPIVLQWGIEFAPVPVPEASTTCLMATLALGAFAVGRRAWQRRGRSGEQPAP